MCDVDWESALSEGHEFLDQVCPFVQEDVEFSFFGFVVKRSLRVQGQSGSVVGGVVKVGVEVEDDGCVGSLHSGSFNMVGVVGESVGVRPDVDLSLLSSRPRGKNFFWRRARPPARGSAFALRVRSSW